MKPVLLGLATLLLPLANPPQQSAAAPAARHIQQLFYRGKAQARQNPAAANRAKKAAIIARVLKAEGGYQNYPDDPANANIGTNWGITPRTYQKYTGTLPTHQTMKALTRAAAANIYAKIWQDAGMNLVPSAAAEALFDFYINTPQTCLQIVEQLTGTKGSVQKMAINPAAAKAIAGMGATLFTQKLNQARKEYYLYRAGKYNAGYWHRFFRQTGKTGSPRNARYLNGWLARTQALIAGQQQPSHRALP